MTRPTLIALSALLLGCTETIILDAGPRDAGSDAGDAAGPDTGGPDAGPCGTCPAATPVCDETSGTCVGCLAPDDCAAPTALCDTTTNLCVACLADGDCEDPTAARCDTGACVPCTDNDQCTVTGAGFCDTGTCVECTVADETPCAGNSCDPATNLCTDTLLGMTRTCDACVADSECVADHRCVPMTYMGAAHGNYCMKIFSTGCMRPFAGTPLMDRISLSGAVADNYCPVNESILSCEAVRALQDSVPCDGGDVTACMAMGARCETVGGIANRCTYTCGTNDNCPDSNDCGGDLPRYCGGP